MKFTFVLALIASVSAIRLNGDKADPDASEKARVTTLEESLKVVATQNSFAAKHFDDHTKAMTKAEKEC